MRFCECFHIRFCTHSFIVACSQIDSDNETVQNQLKVDEPLDQIFSQYIQNSSNNKNDNSNEHSVSQPSEEDVKKADELKTKGNTQMSSQSYNDAIESYTQAINLTPNNKIFYSNRAAAYSQAGQQTLAIDDANKALEIDPQFARAYSRLGHAYYNDQQFENAVKAYEDGLKLDPSNVSMKNSLQTARSRLSTDPRDSVSRSNNNTQQPQGNGMPDLSSLAGMFGGGGAGGAGGGGMPDIGALLNNPMMRQMAQSMMANGGLERMMSNPALRGMAENMRNGGQMPSLDELASNPELRRL